MFGPEFDELIENLKKIPSVTKKQSEKIAFYILNLDHEQLQKLTDSIKSVNQNLNQCVTCNFITKNKQCYICLDLNRRKNLLIVETNNDIIKLEKHNLFDGKYYIFDYKDKENLEKTTNKLLSVVDDFKEVIISLSPTIEGMTFSNYLEKLLADKTNLKVSRIAYGIPIGATIDYMDENTIMESLKNRKEVK
ncbi:toprim domain-containing protein [Mycoplasma procyoni]|uniref:toprim domain-containing protein n=1 Tax=Mycoplasma procyoni TaxID=568784 RepID=UPI00197C2721|nr:toprim domain-containing protein [Mycoplasma procyoni]MBN3534589.1 recombination protein RecR [Mycoplasma procyoni]